jgi:hypothetical protein
MSLQIPILGDLTGLQQALRNVPGLVNSAVGQANAAGSRALGGMFSGLRGAVTGFGGLLKNSLVNAVGAVGIVQTFRSTLQQLDKVGDLSQRFGVSTDALQRLGGVAELSGSSMDSMAQALSRLGRTVSDAVLDPSSQAAEKFGQIGIKAEELKGKGIDEIFMMVAERISRLSSETEQGAAAFNIFGKAGENIRNVLQLGSDEIGRLSSGVSVASQEAVAAAQSIDDAFKSFGQNISQTVGELLVVLTPLINLFLKLANVAASGLGIITTGVVGLFTGDFTQLRNAMLNRDKAIDSLVADPFGTNGTNFSAKTPTRSGRLDNSSPTIEKLGLRDPKDSIFEDIQNIISSGRGIQRGEIIADSLARIGGGGSSVIVGASDREQQRLLQEQLKALQKIEKNTSATEVARLK